MGEDLNKHKKAHSKKKIILFAVVCILAILSLGYVMYVNDYYHADGTALEALGNDDLVSVEQIGNDKIVFRPDNPKAGMIFYPGGKVEYTAYAPLLHELAEQGMFCVLLKMPANLAVLDMNAAEGILEEFPEIQNWYMGGHSLGGSMAAAYVAKHTDEYNGLILFAAYSTADLSHSNLKVISIYGSEDGVLNREKYEKNFPNLPKDTSEYVIEGGCHAQFGSYGAQKGDGIPAISDGEQREETVDFIVEVLGF